MKTDQLHQLLENLNELPPERCWNSIEQQLNIVMPTGGNSINGSNLTSTKSSSIFSKIAAAPLKAAAISGSVIAVSTATIFAIYSLVEQPTINNIPLNNTNTALTTQVDTFAHETTKEIDNNKKETIKPSPIDHPITVVQPNNPVQTTSPSNTPTQQIETAPPQVIVTPQPKPNNIAINPTPATNTPKPVDPVIESNTIPTSMPIKITIPNVFTPNGDGYNDYFVVDGIENCTDSKLFIKSNSGKVVFQSSNYQNDWSGENLPDGVYLYYFVYKVNNIEEKMSGRVIIKR